MDFTHMRRSVIRANGHDRQLNASLASAGLRDFPAHNNAEFIAFLRFAQAFGRLAGFALTVPHRRIEAFFLQKLRVGSAFGNFAVLQHDNLVCEMTVDRRWAMTNVVRSFDTCIKRRLNFAFGVGVERRSRFIQNEDRRRFQNGARDCDPLLFAARKFQAALADHGFVAIRQRRR